MLPFFLFVGTALAAGAAKSLNGTPDDVVKELRALRADIARMSGRFPDTRLDEWNARQKGCELAEYTYADRDAEYRKVLANAPVCMPIPAAPAAQPPSAGAAIVFLLAVVYMIGFFVCAGCFD